MFTMINWKTPQCIQEQINLNMCSYAHRLMDKQSHLLVANIFCERDGNTRPPDLPLEKPVGQEATVRTGYGTTDWFQIGKGVCQGCILSPCLFNLYAEYIMRNSGLEETSWNQDCREKYE